MEKGGGLEPPKESGRKGPLTLSGRMHRVTTGPGQPDRSVDLEGRQSPEKPAQAARGPPHTRERVRASFGRSAGGQTATGGAASCRRQTSKDVEPGDTFPGQDPGQGGVDGAGGRPGRRWAPQAGRAGGQALQGGWRTRRKPSAASRPPAIFFLSRRPLKLTFTLLLGLQVAEGSGDPGKRPTHMEDAACSKKMKV